MGGQPPGCWDQAGALLTSLRFIRCSASSPRWGPDLTAAFLKRTGRAASRERRGTTICDRFEMDHSITSASRGLHSIPEVAKIRVPAEALQKILAAMPYTSITSVQSFLKDG